MEMARQFSRPENFDPYWPPGVPLYLFLVQKIFGESVLVARASIIPVYLAFSVFLFALVRKIASIRAANLAVLLFVFYPPYVRYSFNPSTEYPAAACLMGVVLSMVLARKDSGPAVAVFSGALLALLILVRPSSLLVGAIVAFYFVGKLGRARLALISLTVAATLVSLWMWKAHSMSGRFVMINGSNAQNFFWGNNPYTPLYGTWGEAQAKEGISAEYRSVLVEIENRPWADRDRLYSKLAVQHIVSRPDLFVIRTLNRTRAYFGFPVHHAEPLKSVLGEKGRKLAGVVITVLDAFLYWPIVVLAICFFFSSASTRKDVDSKLILLGAAFAYALPYWVSMSQPRYNFPVVPLLAVPATILLERLTEEPAADLFRPIVISRIRRYVLILLLAGFLYIQLEWIYMASFYLPV
jgi:4-amino-4-deoxy-L-arabinose transferase-like glycosyltransferase